VRDDHTTIVITQPGCQKASGAARVVGIETHKAGGALCIRQAGHADAVCGGVQELIVVVVVRVRGFECRKRSAWQVRKQICALPLEIVFSGDGDGGGGGGVGGEVEQQ
jgi:hypothetical protein